MDRRSRRQPCHPYASPNSATQYVPPTAVSGCPGKSVRPTQRRWCCPQGKVTVLGRAQTRSLECASSRYCAQHMWATEFARKNGKSLASGPLFPDSSGNAATKVQVSSTVRQTASLLGMPLETADRSTSPLWPHLEGHWSHVLRILCYRRVENPVARPLGLPRCLEVRPALLVASPCRRKLHWIEIFTQCKSRYWQPKQIYLNCKVTKYVPAVTG